MSSICVSDLTTSGLQIPTVSLIRRQLLHIIQLMRVSYVNKVLHQPDASMVNKSQVANIMQMLSEETQVHNQETSLLKLWITTKLTNGCI